MEKYYRIVPSDELYHHGIKGQKWGFRRFQNEDGTYTSEGKRRRREEYSEDYKEAKELSKKKSSQLSNAELKKLNNRYELEQKRRQYEGRTQLGNNWFNTVGKKLREKTAEAVAAALVTVGIAFIKQKKNEFRNLESLATRRG